MGQRDWAAVFRFSLFAFRSLGYFFTFGANAITFTGVVPLPCPSPY
jgi:hypothetical protein